MTWKPLGENEQPSDGKLYGFKRFRMYAKQYGYPESGDLWQLWAAAYQEGHDKGLTKCRSRLRDFVASTGNLFLRK